MSEWSDSTAASAQRRSKETHVLHAPKWRKCFFSLPHLSDLNINPHYINHIQFLQDALRQFKIVHEQVERTWQNSMPNIGEVVNIDLSFFSSDNTNFLKLFSIHYNISRPYVFNPRLNFRRTSISHPDLSNLNFITFHLTYSIANTICVSSFRLLNVSFYNLV